MIPVRMLVEAEFMLGIPLSAYVVGDSWSKVPLSQPTFRKVASVACTVVLFVMLVVFLRLS